jgi:short-subunit dehydrogenase
MEQLRGRNALLTGAAGGLGGYIAPALAREGVNLVLSDLPSASVEDRLEATRALGVGAEAVPFDLTDTARLESLLHDAEGAIGRIDILVNNAGLEFVGPFEGQTREELEAILSVNLLAVMELTRLALPGMLERGRGHVLNMASMAGKTHFPYLAAYCATKHAVVGLTHSLRAEHGSDPVGFTAICPGFVGRVGMYGRYEDKVTSQPRGLRPVPPEAVGAAVVKAIRSNRAEVLVNSVPARPLAALAATAPGTVARALGSERVMESAREAARVRGRL